MSIHQTLTDDETGKTYLLVSKPWVVTITVLTIVVFTSVVGLTVYTISHRSTLDYIRNRVEIQRQRNLAMDEMLRRRADIQKWTYKHVCELAKSKGQECLEQPLWWADPNKYPALKNDPSGTGLFPERE